jgi:hypothetical protein
MATTHPSDEQFEVLRAFFGNHSRAATCLGYAPESYRAIRRTKRISAQGKILIRLVCVLIKVHPQVLEILSEGTNG